MKRKVKMLFIVLAACAMSAFGMLVSGCNLVDKVKEKIDQARCEHEWSESKTTKEATCIEVGESTKTCVKCGKIEKEVLELGDCVGKKVAGVAPTCTEKGKTDSVICGVCGKVIVPSQELEALGHIAVTDEAVAPTCLDSGLTEGDHCLRCDKVFHAQERIPATGHDIVVWESLAATCTSEGKAQGLICDNCGMIFADRETIPKLAHEDLDGDQICDYCGKSFGAVLPVEGEAVAGKTYRLYASENYMAAYGNNYDIPYPTAPQMGIIVTTASGEQKTLYVTVCGESFEVANQSEKLFSSVWGDGYRDVTFNVGVYTVDGYSFSIDSTTTIEFFYDEPDDASTGYVRRLDFIE